MKNEIKGIQIVGLYGNRNYNIRFVDNTLIIIGENGAGKTTISRIIYATLSCNWDLLNSFPFRYITVFFEDDTVKIDKECITNIYKIQDIERMGYVERRSGRRGNLVGIISQIFSIKKEKNDDQLRDFYRITRVPYDFIANIIDNEAVNKLFELTQKIEKNFTAQILYLPTYRRIEEQLQNIFPDMDMEIWEKRKSLIDTKRAIELVEFGMNDVKRMVDSEMEMLRSSSQARQNKLTLGYLGEIVSKTYDHSESYKRIRELTDDEIKEVLSRIDSSILSEERKAKFLESISSVKMTHNHSYSAQVKILCHYFLQLWEFNNEIKKAESNIRRFEETVNKYLVSNIIQYNSERYECGVFNVLNGKANKERIEFQQLSSGEKQIVSLFSHLCLDGNDAVFVFIDEPELSLSVDWQKSFLVDIVNSPKFIGLLATTHSPFVFDNELEEKVYGINEFIEQN
ncbi:MAG: ATP-binding protein [Clostridia bacterium]|nr:ATP-binding protein [Clostridia bacterium]